MELVDVMHTYFRGERLTGLALVPVGVAFLAAAVWLYRTESGGFMWGLVVPLTLVGTAALLGGPGLVVRTAGQVAALEQGLASEARQETVAAERARMAKVDANWPRLKVLWAVLAVAALGSIFAVRREWALGLGLALMLLATTGFFLDVFAERRAAPYSRALAEASRAE